MKMKRHKTTFRADFTLLPTKIYLSTLKVLLNLCAMPHRSFIGSVAKHGDTSPQHQTSLALSTVIHIEKKNFGKFSWPNECFTLVTTTQSTSECRTIQMNEGIHLALPIQCSWSTIWRSHFWSHDLHFAPQQKIKKRNTVRREQRQMLRSHSPTTLLFKKHIR